MDHLGDFPGGFVFGGGGGGSCLLLEGSLGFRMGHADQLKVHIKNFWL